ncbi:Ribonuclease VapC32 [bacterium HR33]|nr:Ribonuclease VapC32 [bacterium HR33]
MAPVADHSQVLALIERRGLAGRGIGWVDADLLASALIARAFLWTMDRSLDQQGAPTGELTGSPGAASSQASMGPVNCGRRQPLHAMPTYVYETIPTDPHASSSRFEVRQAMDEPPLTTDPETGAPVRRVISGGLVTLTKKGEASQGAAGPECGPDTCTCGRFN